MTVRYLVTPAKGRVGRFTDVKPFEVEVDSKPHNLKLLARSLSVAIAHVANERDVTTSVYIEGPSHCFKAEAFTLGDTLLAQIYIETLE